jgi:hypothetical protein
VVFVRLRSGSAVRTTIDRNFFTTDVAIGVLSDDRRVIVFAGGDPDPRGVYVSFG